MGELQLTYKQNYFLYPAECDARRQMPIALLMLRTLEVATLHANALGTGVSVLSKDNQSWVVQRLTVEMKRYPRPNETYAISTWVESFNRFFVNRNFAVYDSRDEIIGYIRTVWCAIDLSTRKNCDISKFSFVTDVVTSIECPIAEQSRLRPLKDYRSADYTFSYSDLDFNRHVRTCRYIELLLDQWGLDFHDNHIINRFEISFINEAHYSQKVNVRVDKNGTDEDTVVEMVDADTAKALCRARLVFTHTND